MNKTELLARLIGSNIRRERLRQDFSQEQLAEKVSKTAQYLSLLENGDRCGSVSTYFEISEELGISIGELFANNRTDRQT
jgi:transcriptional regulator with XRE-family HTH domain